MGTTAKWPVTIGLCGLFALGTVTSATAQGTGQHIWSHQSGEEGWIGRVVSIGNEGTQVFSEFSGFNGFARLLSGSDANPASPVWQAGGPFFSTGSVVASASRANVHATLHFAEDADQQRRAVVRAFSSSSPSPMWSYTFPATAGSPAKGLHVVPDGNRVIAWLFLPSSLETAVAVFDDGSGVPTSYFEVDTHGQPIAGEASADGSTLYFATQTRTIVVDVNTAAVLHQSVNWDGTGSAHAISGDGDLVAQAQSLGRLRVLRRNGAGYQQWFTHVVSDATSVAALELSEDGSVLAVGFNHGNEYLRVTVQALDLVQEDQPVVLADTFVGEGAFTNVVSGVAVSSDGARVAFGLTGDESNLVPELVAYSRSGSTFARVFSFDLPGSANALALSPDGRHLASASKARHMSAGGSGGSIDLFEVEGSDLVLSGIPVEGGVVTVSYYTRSAAPVLLLRSDRMAETPFSFAGGTLLLDRASLSIESTTSPASGVAGFQLSLPDGTAGSSSHYQAYTITPRRLSRSSVKLTVLPQ